MIKTVKDQRRWVAIAFAAVAMLLPLELGAQDWRASLNAEKTQNAQKIQAIDDQAAPLAAEVWIIKDKQAAHNAEKIDRRNVAAVNAYNARADALNTRMEQLHTQLQTLVDQQDRLRSRNTEIDRLLRCVPRPIACSSDGDCQQCESCGQLGEGGLRVCHPRR